MKNRVTILLMILCAVLRVHAEIVVRPALEQEIDAILDLDRRVTFEFFYPLFIETLDHLRVDADSYQILEDELAADMHMFAAYCRETGNDRLHVAWDTGNNSPCGLLTFHKENDTTVQLDLLLVDAAYRGQGVGKKLVHSVFEAFDGITTCVVYPLQYNNENTLAFYKALGFKNLGLAPADKYTVFGVSYADLYYYLSWSPARATFQAGALPKDAVVEIKMTAVK